MGVVSLREVTEENLSAILALRVAPSQVQFVGTVEDALKAANDVPEAAP